MSPTYPALQALAAEAAARHDDDALLDALQAALAWPGAAQTPTEWQDLCARMATVWPSDDELLGVWKKMAKKPADRDLLTELGEGLLEREMPDEAATVLMRAWNTRRGDEDLMSATICALEAAQRHPDAFRILTEDAEKRLRETFTGRYLTAFNGLMCSNPEPARAFLPGLLKHPDTEHAEMAQELGGMLARFDAAKPRDLRAWHLVVNGSLLLQTAPTDDGRHSALEDSAAAWRHTLELARRLAEALPTPVKNLWRLEEPRSRVMANAAAALWGWPVTDLPSSGGSLRPGLILAHDLDALAEDTLDALQWHRPDQVLVAHAACFEEEPPFAADAVGHLYAYIRPAFSDAQLKDEAACVKAVVDARVDAALVEREFAAASALLRDTVALAPPGAPAVVMRAGERRRQRVDSPVPRAG